MPAPADRGPASTDPASAEPAGTGPQRRRRWRRGLAETVITLLVAALLSVLLRAYAGEIFWVPSASMVPTLAVYDRIVVQKAFFNWHDHPHVLAELAGQQRRLQRVQVVMVHADDRGGPGQPGLREGLRGPRAAGDVRHSPAGKRPRQARIRVIVDDHRRDPGQAQLLDNAQADPPEPANDHMPAPVSVRSRHLPDRPTHR